MSFPASFRASFAKLRRRYARWRSLGARGERHAARLLRAKGHRILLRGERSRFGELDIVTIDERSARRTVVFVEVKTRRDERAGSPLEAVTPAKARRLVRLAHAFLKAHDLSDHPTRIDVVGIVWPVGARRPTKTLHVEDAIRG
ncbi:MAG: YraN family protein [Lacipirellulaceae bacterium]